MSLTSRAQQQATTNSGPPHEARKLDALHHLIGLLQDIALHTRRSERGAGQWEANTLTLDAGTTGQATLLVRRRDMRRRMVVTNTGANPAFLSPSGGTSSTGMGAILIKNGVDPTNPRVLYIDANVYAWSPLGTTLDMFEELDPLLDIDT